MPWIGRSALERLKTERDTALAELAGERSRRERVELEYDRLRSDHNQLVQITVGRIPPRLGQPLLDKDPFEELPAKPGMEQWLSPSEDEIVLPQGVLDSIEKARGEDA